MNPNDAAKLAGEPLPRHIEPVIQRCWQAITAAAVKLASDGEIGHEDVCSALAIPAAENSLERAAILSGAAPGSFTVTRPVE